MGYTLLDENDQPPKGRYTLLPDVPAKAKAADDAPGGVASFGAGLGRGFGSTVLTLQQYLGKALAGADDLVGSRQPTLSSLITGKGPDRSFVGKAGQWLIDDAVAGKDKLTAELAPYEKAHPIAAGAGDVGGGIAATWPVGGILGKGITSLSELPQLARAAPQLAKLAKAAETSGLKTGAPLAADATLAARAADLATRSAGGALTGATSAALAAPDHVERGAVLGALLPPGLIATAKFMRYGGKVAQSVVQPFTETGQDAIAARIIQKFGSGGPMAVDAAELVPGSLPTLAEATGNAGIATLQRGVRDLRPNAFAEREAGNAAARTSAFDQLAGDTAAIDAAAAARGNAADALYGRAFAADGMRRGLAQEAQATRAPFSGVGLSGAADDLATPGLRELASRPMFQSAMEDAKRLAANKGVKLDDPLQSLEGLHYIKLALDDALNPAAKSAMGRNASAAVMDMRDKLAGELAQVSPLYGTARQTFAGMSQPINAMEALQGLRLTDARGNMTLAKVKNGIEGLERLQTAPGVSTAKSIAPEQMDALRAIQADLLRQDLLNKGRSMGSNTFQNIATDNILTSLLPGSLGEAVKGKAGGLIGQAGKLAYSGSNEAIRNRLTDMMLTPELLQSVLARQQAISGPTALERLLQLPGVQQSLVRTGPVAADQ
jgi:hypothetical protein